MSMTPEEQKVLDDIKAAQEAGQDPFGDDEEIVRELPDDKPSESSIEDADAADGAENAAGEEGKSQEIDEAALNDVLADDEPAPAIPAYQAAVPEDYKAQRADLLKAKAEAMKKLMDGELDAEEFAVEESRISDALEELTAQRIRAETLIEANQQSQAAYQQRAIQRLVQQSKAQIDYTADAKAQRQFDTALQAISVDPDNAGKDFADLLQEAHRVVLALRGIPVTKGEAVASAVAKAATTRQPEGKPPVTLRNIPAASTPNANGDMLDQLGRLSGQEYEAAYARLSPAQKRALLDE